MTNSATAGALAPNHDNQDAYDEMVANFAHHIAAVSDLITDHLGEEVDLNGDPVDTEYLVPFLTSSVLGKIAWSFSKSVEDTEKGLKGLAARGVRLARRSAGSEIEDLEVQKNTHRIHQRESQLEIAQALADAARQVYEDQTGRTYGQTTQADPSKQTAASIEAEALAKRWGSDPKSEKRSTDNRPAIYVDADGNKYGLNADGHYEAI